MKKLFAVLLAIMMAAVSALAFAEESQHHFATFETKGGTGYNLFVITKLNYGADHKVTSVTGHYERVVQGEEYEESEEAPESEITYPLAADFKAEMLENTYNSDLRNIPVTDLYQWYIDSYVGRDNYDGHELVFQCDLPADKQADGTYDFWFVTTRIELNEQNEIQYMEYVYVPWS